MSSFLAPFCPQTGAPHPPAAAFCQACGGNRITPKLKYDVDGVEMTKKPPTPRARASQDHLNAANSRQQGRERNEAQQKSSSHAGSPAISARPSADVIRPKGDLGTLLINTTLWYGAWKWANKAKTIKAPCGKDIFIQSLRFRVRNQPLDSKTKFLTEIVAPRLRNEGYDDFADKCLQLTVATGPPLKDRPRNSVIATGLDDFQTLRGFVTDCLDFDKASEAWQLHLILSAEEESEDEILELPPNSPPRVHKQRRMDIGPLSYEKKNPKAKAKIKKEGERAIKQEKTLPQPSASRQPRVKAESETLVKEEDPQPFTSFDAGYSDDDLPTLNHLVNSYVNINDINPQTPQPEQENEFTELKSEEENENADEGEEDSAPYNTRHKSSRRGVQAH